MWSYLPGLCDWLKDSSENYHFRFQLLLELEIALQDETESVKIQSLTSGGSIDGTVVLLPQKQASCFRSPPKNASPQKLTL